ncbi:hypothetical protein LTR53_012565, partial [Teratosphaeriaceae sp. CCFEE 6253]
MAALVATYNGDLLARDWRRRGTRRPKTGPIDPRHELSTRIKALVVLWEQRCQIKDNWNACSHVALTCDRKQHDRKDLYKPLAAPAIGTAPPPYEDCLLDAPPDYTVTDALTTAQLDFSTLDWPEKNGNETTAAQYSGTDDVDLTSPAGVRMHAKKKAKAAAKTAQKDKWAGSDDEGEKEPGAGDDGGAGDGADGGDAGFGAGGDGGDPPGDGNGGDGGDGDDWTGNTGKGKKKKKKNAWEEYEAEEASKK